MSFPLFEPEAAGGTSASIEGNFYGLGGISSNEMSNSGGGVIGRGVNSSVVGQVAGGRANVSPGCRGSAARF
ncbi:hypothetical protein [Schlesneria sp. T3-172]|uniref:hypothetical protein n=1 Tax=Schlesneria TaxID=656899 RepID=UPI002F1E2AE2